jgi:molecular chaperone GrpE
MSHADMNHANGNAVPPEEDRDLDSQEVSGAQAGPRDEGPADASAPQRSPEEEALARAAELADKLQRVEAGFVNETKRIRRQAEQDRKFAIEKVVVDLLPVVDALGSARETLGEGEAADAVREGLGLVEKQLATVLERYGVAEIPALGQPFDPALHQAMMMVDNPNYPPQAVCEVLRAGYELNGRVVRAAEVLVVKTPPAASADAGAEAGAGEDA